MKQTIEKKPGELKVGDKIVVNPQLWMTITSLGPGEAGVFAPKITGSYSGQKVGTFTLDIGSNPRYQDHIFTVEVE